MEIKMIYVLRHGEIEGSAGGCYVGQTDFALSEKGRIQAGLWAHRLENQKIGAVICSDLTRSSETAGIIADSLKMKVRIEKNIREINLGDWDGRPMQEVRAEFPTAWKRRGECIDTFRPPRGESFLDLYRRVVPVFAHIAETAADPVLIVGHVGVNRVILCHVLGMPVSRLFALRQDYGAMNLIDNTRSELQVAAVNIPAGSSPD